MMKILVTGSTGFLGRNLAEGLSGKYDLLTPTHEELDLVNAENVKKYLEENKPNVVVHTAAVGVTRDKNESEQITKINVEMFKNLVEHQNFFIKLIFCGSGAVYDKRRALVMVKEEEFGQSVPVDPYGAYKYECSKVIQQSETMIDLRMFGVFGKYEDIASRFISHAICRALLDLPIAVIQNVKFEYLYVNDFVKVVEHFVANPNKHKAYNVGNGQPVDLLTIAKKIEKISAKVLDISVNTPGYNKEYTCDNSRLMSELGNFEFTPLDSALLELYNWYKEHLGEIDKSKLV